MASVLSSIFCACIRCDSRSLLPCQSSDFGVKPFGEGVPITRPVTTLMTVGAQGYSIGDAIRTLLGKVLDVMCFKKWQLNVHKKALSKSGLYGVVRLRNQSQLNAPPV
ncbi:hypothetical protein VO64_1619 [Pseudomonas synxantha]|uniref:Uncharacterized protein n=1 Tax=Pseudomonas synxantha TaxID=47883 RepID=A0AAU8TTK0_9PSED|nr:hypothetical protein VO64_1619 [Pseudomonas synxantha]